MSTVLGFIHEHVYQQARHTALLADSLAQALSPQCAAPQQALCDVPVFPDAPLKELIMPEGIHASLQRLIALADSRLDAVLAAMHRHQLDAQGQAYAAEHGTDCARGIQAAGLMECWQHSTRFWTDGMPCDWGVSVHASDSMLTALIKPGVHLSGAAYFELRAAWLAAFAQQLGFCCTMPHPGEYCITKENVA